MKFSVVAALCAAPLALAGTLHADLFRREVEAVQESSISESSETSESGESSNSKSYNDNSKSSSNSNSNSNSHSNNNNNNDNSDDEEAVVIIQEQIIFDANPIWVYAGGSATTQTVGTLMSTATSAAQTPAGVAEASATHIVVVGGLVGTSPNLVYTPDTIEANVGDIVQFQFMSQNHTATQSAFLTPCEKLSGGFDTGFMPNPNNSVVPPPAMAFQVTVSTPIWFYCRQTGHCGKGMTFSINPTANKTQAMFEQMAIAQNGTGATAVIAGGSATTTTALASAATESSSGSDTSSTSSSSSGGTGVVAGSGTLDSTGACSCSCLCGVAAFPDVDIQGVASFGGMSGSIQMAALPGK